MKRIAVGVIKLYQIVRKPFPSVCRFTPSCSQYAVEALQKYGFWKGSFLALKRLLRCHPFGPGGHDPLI